jgi:hypothetical protein
MHCPPSCHSSSLLMIIAAPCRKFADDGNVCSESFL